MTMITIRLMTKMALKTKEVNLTVKLIDNPEAIPRNFSKNPDHRRMSLFIPCWSLKINNCIPKKFFCGIIPKVGQITHSMRALSPSKK
jgi:hypothetical protein